MQIQIFYFIKVMVSHADNMCCKEIAVAAVEESGQKEKGKTKERQKE